MPFNKSKLKKAEPKEGWTDAALRLASTGAGAVGEGLSKTGEFFHENVNKPLTDFIPGGQAARENLANPNLMDADQQALESPRDVQRPDDSNSHWLTQLAHSGIDFAKDAAKIPTSTARQKGFVSGALGAINLKTAAQIAGLFLTGGASAAMNLPAVADDTYGTFKKDATGTERLISALGGIAGLAGFMHGRIGGPHAPEGGTPRPSAPKPVEPTKPSGGAAALPVAGMSPEGNPIGVAPKTWTSQQATEAAERLRVDKPLGAAGRRPNADILADHALVDADTLKNPGGKTAVRVAKEGRPNVTRNVEQKPAIAEEDALHDKGLEVMQKERQDAAATDALVKEAQIKKVEADAKLSAKAKAQQIKDLDAGFKANADATKGLNKAEATVENLRNKAHGPALVEDQARTLAADRQAKIDAFKNRADVETSEPTLKTAYKGQNEAGGQENLSETTRVKPPDEEDGDLGGLGGGSDLGGGGGGEPVLPVNSRHFTAASARRAVEHVGGDPTTHNIIKRGDNDYQVVLRGQEPAAAQPTFEVPGEDLAGDAGAPVEPKGPAPTGPNGLSVEDVLRAQFDGKVVGSKKAAEDLAKHVGYGAEAHEYAPRKWRVRFPSQAVEVPPADPNAVPFGAEGGNPSGKFGAPVAEEPIVPTNSTGNLNPEEANRLLELQPQKGKPALKGADLEEFKQLTAKANAPAGPKIVKPWSAADEVAGAVDPEATPLANANAAPAESVRLSDAEHQRYIDLNNKFTAEGDLTPDEYREVFDLDNRHSAAIAADAGKGSEVQGAAAQYGADPDANPVEPDVPDQVNPQGEAEPVLPGMSPTVNPAVKPVAEVPYALERESARVAKAKESVNPLFEAQMDALHPEETAGTAPKILEGGNGTNPVGQPGDAAFDAGVAPLPEPDLPAMAEQPGMTPQEVVADIQARQAGVKAGRSKSMMGSLAKQLKPEGAAPVHVPEGIAEPEFPEELAGIPKNRLLQISQGNLEGNTKAQLLVDNGMKQAAPLGKPAIVTPQTEAPPAPPEAGLRVAPEPEAPAPTQIEAPVAAPAPEPEPTLESILSELPPEEVTPALVSRIKKFLANQKGGGGGGMTGQGGFATSEIMRRMALGGLSGTAAYQRAPEGEEVPYGIAGGLFGAFSPELYRGGVNGLTKLYAGQTGRVLRGMDILNKAHNTGLLSPLSVVKKAAGDIGGLSMAAIENQERAGDIARQFLTKAGRQGIKANFLEGYKGPEAEQIENGIENFFQNKYLSVNGRLMGGLTKATKGILGESGFTPAEQAYYTLTAKPKYELTKGLSSFLTGGGRNAETGGKAFGSRLLQHLSPFARIGINRLERGFEYSPLGFLTTKGATSGPEEMEKVFKKALIGTGIMGATYAVTPEDYVKEHPKAASTLAAMAGPLGIPVIAAMAMKTKPTEEGDTWGDATKKMARASAAIGRDIPGLRLMEDLTGRGFPEGFARNYLSGYTNIVAPEAQLLDQLRGTPEPDVSSPDLPLYQRLGNRAASNIPGVRDLLPRKDGEEMPSSNGPITFDPLDIINRKK